jgi:retron-type reverse transcriptase
MSLLSPRHQTGLASQGWPGAATHWHPTFEDKVVQRAVVMLLEAVYEQDFYDVSYGFRPGLSAHAALGRFGIKSWIIG